MGLDEASWVTLPRTGERLSALTYFGNGKDADLTYTGAHVYLRHGRIGFTDDEPWRAEFLNAAREWLDAAGGDDLGFVVSAELTLGSATGVAQPA